MSETSSNPAAPESPGSGGPKLNPVKVFFALGSEVRMPIIKMLADGRAMSTSEIAAALGRDLDGIVRQMKVMTEAGIVAASHGTDRRQVIFRLPPGFDPATGTIDFGFCVVNLKAI